MLSLLFLLEPLFRFRNRVEFAHVEQLELWVEMTMDGNFVTDGEVEVDDGEFTLPSVHEW